MRKGLVGHKLMGNEQHLTEKPATKKNKPGFSVRVLRSINGLKQSRRIWYQRFRAEMLNLGFVNEEITPCLFIKQENEEFILVTIYVDDINIFGTEKLAKQTMQNLVEVFEMKDLGKPKYCLRLQCDYLPTGILVSHTTYTKKIVK